MRVGLVAAWACMRTLDARATLALPRRQSLGANIFQDFAAGGYFCLDHRDRAVTPTRTRHIWWCTKPGQVAPGSGTTPTVFGQGGRWLAITDNANQKRVVVCGSREVAPSVVPKVSLPPGLCTPTRSRRVPMASMPGT